MAVHEDIFPHVLPVGFRAWLGASASILWSTKAYSDGRSPTIGYRAAQHQERFDGAGTFRPQCTTLDGLDAVAVLHRPGLPDSHSAA